MAQKKAQVRKSEVHGHWVVVLRGGELEVEIPCGSKAEAQAVREQIAGGREG